MGNQWREARGGEVVSFRNSQDKRAALFEPSVVCLGDTKDSQKWESCINQGMKLKAETRVFVASVDRRRWVELMQQSSKLDERTRLETWVFMVKCNTRVLDSHTGNRCNSYSHCYRVLDLGRKKREIWTFCPRIWSLLQSCCHLVLSLFSVIQDLMSSVHFCMERNRSGTGTGTCVDW